MSNWQNLSNPDIQKFIAAHAKDDVKTLALKTPPDPNWDYPLIMDQIKARQKAAVKTPSWCAQDNIIFPRPDIIEQASSEATALYKASLISGETFIDLTGGAGVDSWAILNKFETARIVDIDTNNAALLEHNLSQLSDKNITVHPHAAEAFLPQIKTADLILIDPQRRENTSGKRGLYRFEDCSPNILEMLPALKTKAQKIMIKTSPMLDIDQAIAQLEYVSEVHVVEWQGDCKELLFILKPKTSIIAQNIPITAVSINADGSPHRTMTFTRAEEQSALAPIGEPQQYLYEPSPAFMKAGGFNVMATRHNLTKLHPDTHLYSADHLVPNFTGRAFEIIEPLPVNKKAIKPHLPKGKANITVRNFPMRSPELAKKLGLKDGGNIYLFACKAHKDGKDENIALLCRKPRAT